MRFYPIIDRDPDTSRVLQLAAEKLSDWIEATALRSGGDRTASHEEQRVVCGGHINVDEERRRTSPCSSWIEVIKLPTIIVRSTDKAAASGQYFPEVWKFSPGISTEHGDLKRLARGDH